MRQILSSGRYVAFRSGLENDGHPMPVDALLSQRLREEGSRYLTYRTSISADQ